MMKKITLLILMVIPLITTAQITLDLKGVVNKKISSIPENKEVLLTEIKLDDSGFSKAEIIADGKKEQVSLNHVDRIHFIPNNSKEFWQIQALKHSVYENMGKKGMQYKLRRDLEDEALEYMHYVEKNDLCFEDSYLLSYLYSLLYKIYPINLEDGRPGILNIRILKETAPNAFIYPNGTLFITTGLLSTINSEDELIGVLAHEVSHFVLDHSIININEAVARQQRAEFWAAFATGLAAATDIYVASNHKYYKPGAITLSTAIISHSIASSVIKRLGLQYSQEQELEADQCAIELMEFINVDKAALASALSKIKDYCILTGNYYALTNEGTHPSLDKRIDKIGEFGQFYSKEYDKKISFVNSFNAIVVFNNLHLNECYNLVNRNIDAGVAVEDDLVLLAMTKLYMYDNEEKNNEALQLLTAAKKLNIYPTINVYKQEAIALIRLEKIDLARSSLLQYQEELKKERERIDYVKNTNEWSYLNEYINYEYEWVVKMINKVNYL